MAKKKHPAGTTAPKGKPTPRRTGGGRRGISSGLQWFLLAIVGVVVLFLLFRLFNTDGAEPDALAALALFAPIGPRSFESRQLDPTR